MRIDADDLAVYWIDRLERLLHAAVRDAYLIPAPQRIDVEFGDFIADDLAITGRILAVAGMEMTAEAREQITGYLAGDPRGKNGRVIYDLRADFGIEPADLYERFAFYFDAFPQVRREVS
jgi:hypothetical protein